MVRYVIGFLLAVSLIAGIGIFRARIPASQDKMMPAKEEISSGDTEPGPSGLIEDSTSKANEIPTLESGMDLAAKDNLVINPEQNRQPAPTTTIITPIIPSSAVSAPPLPVISLPTISTSTSALAQIPPLNEKALFAAVVKIECPGERAGKLIGSGFVLDRGRVVTSAHLIKDAVGDECEVVFPKDRHPAYYFKAKIGDKEVARKRHDEQGIDVAVFSLPALDANPEARAVFPDAYPFIPYAICDDPRMTGDKLFHFGYPSNYAEQDYLERSAGEAVSYADINGITDQLSFDQTKVFKTPIFAYTADETQLHPYMVSRVPTFYGDSGGLAFNATKQCVLGPHRGGTIGGGAGENFSVFPVLGWEKVREFLSP